MLTVDHYDTAFQTNWKHKYMMRPVCCRHGGEESIGIGASDRGSDARWPSRCVVD